MLTKTTKQGFTGGRVCGVGGGEYNELSNDVSAVANGLQQLRQQRDVRWHKLRRGRKDHIVLGRDVYGVLHIQNVDTGRQQPEFKQQMSS